MGRRPTGCARGGRAGSGQKGGFKEAFQAEVVAEIEALVGPGAVDGLDFEAIETAARRRALQVAARAVARRLNADTRDHAGPAVACPCGQAARYAGRRTKTFTSVLGELTLERAYYHCASCARGVFPRDRALGLPDTGVPMRAAELVGRPGKQPDGAAKTREVKLVTVWTAEGRDDDGTPVRDAGSVTYSAAIESAATRDTDEVPSEFAQRVTREARRRGFDQAQRGAVLGDGALWIGNLADEHFPGALQIVDLFHAKQKLSDVAKAVYGATSTLGAHWAKQRHDELDEGQIDAVLAALGVHAQAHDEARKALDYVTRNRPRMRYPAFRAQGLCTSTGVVEAGCKVAIGTRLKRAGMHWTVAGADAIIALRCCKLSGRFEDFWERRAAARAAA